MPRMTPLPLEDVLLVVSVILLLLVMAMQALVNLNERDRACIRK